MKRNLTTIEHILTAIEERDDRGYQASSLVIADVSYEELCYHLDLLLDADFIVAEMMATVPFETWVIDRLTWDGHEYLDWLRCVIIADGGGDGDEKYA